MQRSDSIKELATALSKAQGDIENASKNKKNDHFKNNYADLAEVLNTIRPVFSAHGLSVAQFPSYEPPMAQVETILMHSSGEFMSHICSAPVTKADAQGVGSAVTYLRRYSLAAVAGIAQEDDDMTGAAANNQKSQQQEGQQPPPQPETYPQADFKKNVADWSNRIQAGKPADELIAFIESKGKPFTEDQKKTLRAVKPKAAEQQGAAS